MQNLESSKCTNVYIYVYFLYMTGRIVLSHVHVSRLRRTRSIQKLISTGLASGGIITLAGIILKFFSC